MTSIPAAIIAYTLLTRTASCIASLLARSRGLFRCQLGSLCLTRSINWLRLRVSLLRADARHALRVGLCILATRQSQPQHIAFCARDSHPSRWHVPHRSGAESLRARCLLQRRWVQPGPPAVSLEPSCVAASREVCPSARFTRQERRRLTRGLPLTQRASSAWPRTGGAPAGRRRRPA